MWPLNTGPRAGLGRGGSNSHLACAGLAALLAQEARGRLLATTCCDGRRGCVGSISLCIIAAGLRLAVVAHVLGGMGQRREGTASAIITILIGPGSHLRVVLHVLWGCTLIGGLSRAVRACRAADPLLSLVSPMGDHFTAGLLQNVQTWSSMRSCTPRDHTSHPAGLTLPCPGILSHVS